MVSIAMIVYNHEKYLKKSIESVLNQKFDGKIELVIGEDCSTDKSRKIIEDYEKKYPDIINPIYHQKNIGMKKNGLSVLKNTRGKYLALLEGDDYWIDENKLQKQIDFLENNPEYYGVIHNVCIVDDSDHDFSEHQYLYPPQTEGEYYLDDFLNGKYPGQTASYVLHNCYLGMEDKTAERINDYQMNGDIRILLTMLLRGKVYCMEEKMSAYRYVTTHGDSWNAKVINKNMSNFYYNSACEIERYALEEYGKKIDAKYLRYEALCNSFLELLRRRKKNDWIIFKSVISSERNKMEAFRYLMKKILKKLRSKS